MMAFEVVDFFGGAGAPTNPAAFGGGPARFWRASRNDFLSWNLKKKKNKVENNSLE